MGVILQRVCVSSHGGKGHSLGVGGCPVWGAGASRQGWKPGMVNTDETTGASVLADSILSPQSRAGVASVPVAWRPMQPTC